MTKPKDMPREVFDAALREAFDAIGPRKKANALPWTEAIDAEILRANEVLGIGSRPISAVLIEKYGWGSRGAVEDRLRYLKARKAKKG